MFGANFLNKYQLPCLHISEITKIQCIFHYSIHEMCLQSVFMEKNLLIFSKFRSRWILTSNVWSQFLNKYQAPYLHISEITRINKYFKLDLGHDTSFFFQGDFPLSQSNYRDIGHMICHGSLKLVSTSKL